MPKTIKSEHFDKLISKRLKKRLKSDTVETVVQRVRVEISKMITELGASGFFNISTAQMYRYLRGDTPIPYIVLKCLAQCYEFSIDSLFDTENNNVDFTDEIGEDKTIQLINDCFEKEYAYHFYFSPIHKSDRIDKNKRSSTENPNDLNNPVSAKTSSLIRAIWMVNINRNNEITLYIPPPSSALFGGNKIYTGFPILNEDGEQVFVNLTDDDSEPFQVILNYDENLNQKFIFAMGLALSIRSLNDDKGSRIPVMHRFCLTRDELSACGERWIKERLDLGEKPVHIGIRDVDDFIGFSALWKVDQRFHTYLLKNKGYKVQCQISKRYEDLNDKDILKSCKNCKCSECLDKIISLGYEVDNVD